MPILMKHEDAIFEDQVIYATGHHYKSCEFHRCTFVILGAGPSGFVHCRFSGCSWHLNVVIHERDQVEELINTLTEIIGPSTLKASEDETPNA